MKNNVTCVSGLFNINREKEGDGRKWDEYIEWFKKTLQLNVPMVIFCEEDTYDKIKDIRKKNYLTKIIIIKRDDIYYLKYEEQVKKIVKDINFLKKIKNTDRLEVKHPIYNLLIMNKIKWLKKVSDENYFNSEIFMWVDAGCSRFFKNFNLNNEWPNFKKIEKNKLNIQIKKTLFNVKLENLIYETDHFTTATIFGGGKEIIEFFEKEIYNEFKHMISKNCINNEQIIIAVLYKKYNNKFNIFLNQTNEHLPYFQYLSEL